MKHALYSLLALALVGCPTAEPTAEVEDTQEVRALTRAAVEEVPGVEVIVTEPAALSEVELAEAVPSTGPILSMPEVEVEVAVPPEEDVEVVAFDLRRGETLAHYARWSGVPVEVISATSELDLGGMYAVGTEILVPATAEEAEVIADRRERHRVQRVDSYLATRGGSLGDEIYVVRTNDSAWNIAKNQGGVPVWMVEAYNPGVDLEGLRPGQELLLPILADTVVDAAE